MDERRGRESAPTLFDLHEISSNAAQFLIDARRKEIKCGSVTFRPIP
jgi:hypothetical protein